MKHFVFLLLLIGALSAWTQIQGGSEKSSVKDVAPITYSSASSLGNLDDCIGEIDRLWDNARKETARQQSEAEFVSAQKSGLGSWMQARWDLEGTNVLTQYFHGQGVVSVDEMKTVVLRGYHRHLNQAPVTISELVQSSK